jgi:tRNA pseudouridine55 synthase
VRELRRAEVDPFTAEDLVTLDELEAAASRGEERNLARDFAALDALLMETAAALDCLPQVAVTDDAASRIRLGNSVILRGRDAPVEAEEACATARGKLVAIGAIEGGMFKPRRIFTG